MTTSGADVSDAGVPPAPRFTWLDLVFLAIVGVVWGIAYIFIRQGIVLGASPLLFAASRYALSAAAFAAIALARREPWPERRPLLISATVGGILVIGLYGGFLYTGEQYTSGGYAAVLSTTAPILSFVAASFLLPSERLATVALVGLAVGFAGVVVLVAPTLVGAQAGGWAGPPVVIAAFVSASFGQVLLRRYGGGRQNLWQIGMQFAVGGALLGGAAAVWPTPESLPLNVGVWEALGALVALSSVVGYFGFFALLHRVGPVRATAVTYLIPLVGLAAGTLFLGESITVWEVAGCIVVLAGMTLLVRESLGAAR